MTSCFRQEAKERSHDDPVPVCPFDPDRRSPRRSRARASGRVPPDAAGRAARPRRRGSNGEDRRRPLRAFPGADDPPQRHPPEDARHPGRGGGPSAPEAAGGVVLPLAAAPAAAGRQSALRGDLPGLDRRGVHPQGRASGPRVGQRHRHLPLDSVADLRRDRRSGPRVLAPADRSHLVPLPVPRRHLPRRPPSRPGRLAGPRRRDRCQRRRPAGDPRNGAGRRGDDGLLDRVPPLAARARTEGRHRCRPARRHPGHLRRARRPESCGQGDPAWRGMAEMPGPFRPQRHPEDWLRPLQAGQRADLDDLRADHHRSRHRPIPGRHRQPPRLIPRDRRHARGRRTRHDRVRGAAPRALAESLVEQSHRYLEPASGCR
ncbi:MAG: hypothetical protein BWY91_03148 [bacterium ADurb.BinA028]|nr:MAG: hypothetical protein BWY91_03148 [bacterium ADurb.BinA028]